MSALPNDNAEAPVAAATDTEALEATRHLHPVPSGEYPTEFTTDQQPPTEAAPTSPAAKAAWLREAFTPDSGLYTDRQPSIAETVRRAQRGSHLPDAGPLRTAGKAHGYLAAANKAVAATWVWIVDHPARLVTFTALVALALVFPATRQLVSLLLTPFAWAQQALD